MEKEINGDSESEDKQETEQENVKPVNLYVDHYF